jgi:hypothetical protein
MIDLLGSTFLGSRSALIALDLALKATALMTFAFACHGALGRRRALARSALWNACLIGLLLLPAACLAFPRLHVIVAPTRSMPRYETAAPSHDVPPAAKSAAEDVLSVSESSMDRDTMGSIGSDAVRQPASGRPFTWPTASGTCAATAGPSRPSLLRRMRCQWRAYATFPTCRS